jgi:HJR/Mrr/RecB family endonuclease
LVAGASIVLGVALFVWITVKGKKEQQPSENRLRRYQVLKHDNWGMDESTKVDITALVADIFVPHGWTVDLTASSNGHRHVAILSKGSRRCLVVVALSQARLGMHVVEQAIDLKRAHECTEAAVLSNGLFTTEAVDFCKARNVRLFDKWALVRALDGLDDAQKIAA